jgi:AraC-like DNA-binding protein
MQWQMSDLAREGMPRPDYFRHRHVTFELHYLFDGSCTFRIGDRFLELQKGEVILIGPNVYHSLKTRSDDLSKICMSLHLLPAPKETETPQEHDLQERFLGLEEVVLDGHSAHWLLSALDRNLGKEAWGLFDIEEQKAHLKLLILWLARHLRKQEGAASSLGPAIIDQASFIAQFFNMNFHLPNGAQVLADRLHISRRHLERKLKEQFGKNFRQIQQEIRMEVAKDLLITTDKTIAEIAEQIGFSNTASFCTFIKNTTGTTPSQLRRSLRKENIAPGSER